MNKKLKKGLTIGTTVAIVGGATAGITVGVIQAKDHKTKILKIINGDEEVMKDFNGNPVTIEGLIEKGKTEQEKTSDILVKVRREAAFVSYDEEQEASIKLQKMYFEYDKWRLGLDKDAKTKEKTDKETELGTAASGSTAATGARKELADAQALPTTDTSRQTKIDRANDKIKSLEDRIKRLTEQITAIETNITNVNNNETELQKTDLDYTQSGFSGKFPHVLLKRNGIADKESKKFDDKKANFTAQYKTKADGEKAWIEQMQKEFHASTKQEVIDSKVYSQIQKAAFSRYNFKINSSFTFKQKRSGKFPFLNNVTVENDWTAVTTDTDTTNDNKYDDKKLFFLSADSRNPDEIYQDPATASVKLRGIANGVGISKLQHFLISAKQDAKGGSLPWDVKKDTIKKLFEFYGQGAGNPDVQPISQLAGIFTDATEERDKVLVSAFSDNAAGTINKSGSMGIKTNIDHITGDKLAAGFALGCADLMANPTSANTGVNLLADIKSRVEAIMKDELGMAPGATFNGVADNRKIDELITNMPDDKFKKLIGGAFRDAFGGAGKMKLSYRLSPQAGIIVSSFGVHIVRLKDMTTAGALEAQVDKDLETARKDESTAKIQTNYAELFKNIYTQERIIKKYMEDADFVTRVKANVHDGDKTPDQIVDAINKAIKNRIDGEMISKIIATISDKREKWIVDAYDKHLRDASMSIESIYGEIDKIGGLV